MHQPRSPSAPLFYTDMPKKWSKNTQRLLAFLLGSTVVALLVLSGEWFLWKKGYKPAYRVSQIGGWIMTPHEQNRRMQSPQGHDFLLSTNADGLRGNSVPTKTANGFRIAVLGDSTTFGWGVNDDESVPAQMERFISVYAPSVEVLNAAQPGHSSTQATELFTHIVSQYQPDLSILFLPDHDYNLVLVSDREVLEGGRGWRSQLRVFLARRSALYSWLRLSLFPKANDLWVFPDQKHSEPRVPRVSNAEREENIALMRKTAEKWGGKVWIGMLPSQFDLALAKDTTPMPRFASPWLKEFLPQDTHPFFDLRTCCGPAPDDLVFPYDRGHLNAAGCRAVGRVAAKKLRAHLLSTP